MTLTHLSLFTGYGGLDIAAEWAGIETVGQCEWADHQTAILEKRWPDVPRWRDIRTLTGENFMSGQECEQLTLFPEASPASPSPSPGSEAARMTTVTSGRKWCELLKNSDPIGLLARMLLESSQWHSRLVNLRWNARPIIAERTKTFTKHYVHNKRECFSQTYCETLKTSDIKSNRLLFRLVPSMPRTDATVSPLWATPNTMDHLPQRSPEALQKQAETSRKGRTRPANLREQANPETVRMWPTPCGSKTSGTTRADFTLSLPEAAKLWPTPQAGDYRSVNRNPGSCGDSDVLPQSSHNLVQMASLFPTPRSRETGDYQYSKGDHNKPVLTLTGVAKLYPTPKATDYKGSGPAGSKSQIHDMKKRNLKGVVMDSLYPTPSTGAGLCGGTGNYRQLQKLCDQGQTTEDERRNMSQGNGGQLNPDWVEWMMGLPIGWTEPNIDVDFPMAPGSGSPAEWPEEPYIPRVAAGVPNRVKRLQCLGNGVVPQQFAPIFAAIAEIERMKQDEQNSTYP